MKIALMNLPTRRTNLANSEANSNWEPDCNGVFQVTESSYKTIEQTETLTGTFGERCRGINFFIHLELEIDSRNPTVAELSIKKIETKRPNETKSNKSDKRTRTV